MSFPGNTNINIGAIIKEYAQTEIGTIKNLSKIGAASFNLTERIEAVDILFLLLPSALVSTQA